jgi:hypothetical protein
MSDIEVYRSVHVEQPTDVEEATVASLGYVSNDQNILMETVWYGAQRRFHFAAQGIAESGYTPQAPVIRRSTDNGRTWEAVGEWQTVTPIHGRRELNSLSPNWVVNPRTGSLLRMYTTSESVRGTLPWASENPTSITRLIWTQMSHDGGRGWSQPEQLIVRGEGYDHRHWAPETYYGRNGAGVEGVTPLPTADGRFIQPMFMHASAELQAKGVRWRCALLIGSWRDDDGGVDWELSNPVHVDPAQGHDDGEPSAAFLPDGRLLMTLRSRSFPNDGLPLQSARFYTTSDDLGQTWTDPLPLRYTDGGQVYCPASLAHVLVSGKNGRPYIITNVLDAPTTRGCDPRTTLHIAAMDPTTLGIIRDTVTVIETRDVDAGEPENIRFSNWRRYEDRENGNIVLLMTAGPGDVGRHPGCGCAPHSYRYDIVLPD